MCSRDARFKNFKDSILGMTTVSLYDGPIYFNCYPEPSFPYSRPASEEEDDGKSICPSDGDFPPIDNSNYIKQLRVLTILNENFEVIWFLCRMSICFQKTELKEDISKIILLSLRKTVLKENG